MKHALALALVALLTLASTAAEPGKLELQHIEAAYGVTWPRRESPYYPPRDELFYRFLIHGAALNSAGGVDLNVETKLLDAAGKTVASGNMPVYGQPTTGFDPLLGFTSLPLTEALPPGKYRASVTVTDKVSSAQGSFEREVEIKAPEFAVQSLRVYADPDGQFPVSTRAQLGQTLCFRLWLIGVSTDQGWRSVKQKIEVLDAKTRQPVAKPLELTADGAGQRDGSLCLSLNFALSHPGEFILCFTLTDEVARKTVAFETPLHVAVP